MPLAPEQRRQIIKNDALINNRAGLFPGKVRRRAMNVVTGKVERALLDHPANSNIEPPGKKNE